MAGTTIDGIPMLIDATLMLFFVVGLAAVSLGLVLLLVPGGFERLSKILGRRYSARRVMKPLEVPHYHEAFFYRHHLWTGGLILAGALFFFFNLVLRFNLETAAAALPGVAWIWSGVLWALIVGNLSAVVVGGVILLRPNALASLETVANRWVSLRRASRPLDKSHDRVDQLASRYPRSSGALLLVAGLFLVMISGLMLAG